jgi:hypothetical protein
MLHEAVRAATFEAGGGPGGAGGATVRARPMTGTGEIGRVDAGNKASLVTSLYYVAAWIPSVQARFLPRRRATRVRRADGFVCSGWLKAKRPGTMRAADSDD